MNLCNWNIFNDDWSNFIKSKIVNTQDKDLISWILQKYFNESNKIYPRADLMLSCCVQPNID